MSKKQIHVVLLVAILVVAGIAVQTYSHCQLPCGIYDDDTRFSMLEEHITTIEKSMKMIDELSMSSPENNTNQIVRWVNNKETHADDFSHIVTFYFLAQRIKPVDSSAAGHKAYLSKLEMLHNMIVYSMKCKQTTDTANTDKLKSLVADFKKAYYAK